MNAKQLVLSVLTQDLLVPLWRPLVRDRVCILMLHRFADANRGIRGASIADLRANLALLRRHRFHLASMQELLKVDGDPGEPTSLSIVFTIDDGYADFASVAAPLFAEFDCPVTVFLVTGAVDGATWFWWDRIEHVLESTRRVEVGLEVAGQMATWKWQEPAQRRAAASAIAELLKTVSNEERERALVALADLLEVEVPAQPPLKYAAMSWSDVRRCAERGATFGPHTVTHPMLTKVSDSDAKREILDSWQRLRTQTPSVVPVFCYPNGAFAQREISILASADLSAAVTTEPQYTSRRAFTATDNLTRFCLPRFAYTGDRSQLVQVVAGIERLKMTLRQGRAGWRPAAN